MSTAFLPERYRLWITAVCNIERLDADNNRVRLADPVSIIDFPLCMSNNPCGSIGGIPIIHNRNIIAYVLNVLGKPFRLALPGDVLRRIITVEPSRNSGTEQQRDTCCISPLHQFLHNIQILQLNRWFIRPEFRKNIRLDIDVNSIELFGRGGG
ncbi:hypothetical protein D3C77_394970 [compost metagenome]